VSLSEQASVLARLMAVIEDRKANPPAKSYTTTLFAGGVEKIGGKLLEEAEELIEAARVSTAGAAEREHLIYEAGDVLYHLLVMLGYRDIKLSEVEAELARRFGVSGLDEKAARHQTSD
jgi:phosphoribosyl-ATP pyrophosphohydrolase